MENINQLLQQLKKGGQDRINALEIICFDLSPDDENKVMMGSSQLGLVQILVDVIKEDKAVARYYAIGTCQDLSTVNENLSIMGSPQLGLVQVLVGVIKEDKADARNLALGTCQNLSVNNENKAIMGSPQLGLVQVLVGAIKEDKADARNLALGTCRNLSLDNENKAIMGLSELGLVQVLVGVIKEDKADARNNALATCQNLSVNNENKMIMGSVDIGLVPILAIIANSDQVDARTYAICILWNLVASRTVSYMIASNVHVVLFNLLKIAGDCNTFKVGEYTDHSINFFLAFTRYPIGAKAVRSISTSVEVFMNMLSSTSINKLKASFIISNLTGRDEAFIKGRSGLLSEYPELSRELISVFENTMDAKGGDGYYLGNFIMR